MINLHSLTLVLIHAFVEALDIILQTNLMFGRVRLQRKPQCSTLQAFQQIKAVFAGGFAGNFVACIGMTDDTHARIIVQYTA